MSHRSIRSDLKPVPLLDVEFTKGGLGDSIARLPTIRYILENYPHVEKIRLIAQDYFKEVVEHFFHPDRVEFVGASDRWNALKANPSKHATHTDTVQHTTLRTHLTHHAFATVVNETPLHPSAYNYLKFDLDRLPTTINLLPKKYIVLTTGYTSKNREFPAKEVNQIVQWAKIKGYDVVFLGKQQSVFHNQMGPTQAYFDDDLDTSLGIDLIDKTTLLEAAKIMGRAAAVVGVDNGLIHLAGMTDVPIIAGYTIVSQWHRMPIRNNVIGYNVQSINSSIGCAPCQTKANFLYDFDFRRCYYGDYKCTEEMNAKAFIKSLEFVCP
jgi:ADP-heptose:LPS heptosyltransferase